MLAGAAEPPDGEAAHAVLVFEAGGAAYGLDAASVEAVVASPPVARLPYPPRGAAGVASVRGRMRLVVDPGGSGEAAPRLIVLHGDSHLAVLADSVAGVVAASPDELAAGLRHAGRRVALLDPEALLGDD